MPKTNLLRPLLIISALVLPLLLSVQPGHAPGLGKPAHAVSAQEQARKNQSDKNDQQHKGPVPGAAAVAYSPAIAATKTYAKQVDDRTAVLRGVTYPLRTYKALYLPNDPSVNQTWVSQANIAQAWDTPRGNNPTLLAVIDTGFALKHEEFADRWYANTGEQGAAASEAASKLNCTDRSLALNANCNLIDDDGDGTVDNESGTVSEENPSRRNCSAQSKPLTKDCNNIDDDANGFVDDVSGWDFIHHDNNVQAGEIPTTADGGKHGTYVAAVAAATGNNGRGIAGVDWGTKLLPIQVLDDAGTGDTVAVANGILYAVSRGADVISLSLGSSASDPLVRDAVQQAIAAGAVVVAAAGNDGCDCMSYPANYPEVLSVGALNGSGAAASFSSYGVNLDVMAPGVNIYTAEWRVDNQINAYAGGISGTSLATPIVSGLLTRIKSQRPSATPLQLIAALTETVKRTHPQNVSHTSMLGFGQLDGGAVTARMANAFAPAQQYVFDAVSLGNKIGSSPFAEKTAAGFVYACFNQTPGSTPIYTLRKGTETVYSASTAEVARAQSTGYSATFFAYGCISQGHDNPGAIRQLNTQREFFNVTTKP